MNIRILYLLVISFLLLACNNNNNDIQNHSIDKELFISQKDSLLNALVKKEALKSDFCNLELKIKSTDKKSLRQLRRYLKKQLDFSSKIEKEEDYYKMKITSKSFNNSIEGILVTASFLSNLAFKFNALPIEIKLFENEKGMKVKFTGENLFKKVMLKHLFENYFNAYQYVIKYISNHPDDDEAVRWKAKILRKCDLESIEIASFYKYNTKNISEFDSDSYIIRAFYLAGKKDESALNYINKFIAKQPSNPLGKYFRGLIKLDLGDNSSACKDLEGFEIYPKYIDKYEILCP